MVHPRIFGFAPPQEGVSAASSHCRVGLPLSVSTDPPGAQSRTGCNDYLPYGSNPQSVQVAVVGTGRVGLPFAAATSLHFATVALDANATLVERINRKDHFDEPGVDSCLANGNLRASTDLAEVAFADLVVVCVGSQDGRVGYRVDNPLSVLKAIAPHLRDRRQLLCIMSTLPPRAVVESVLPFLRESGLAQRIRGFAYTPTMIALGEAVQGFQHPEYVMVGSDTPATGDEVERFWKTIAGPSVPVIRSSIENVAVAKYVLNIALVLKISLMNLTAEFCERLDGDVDVVADIFRKDPRIAGQKMFRGGLGFGGTCFPIDVVALMSEAERAGMPSDFLRAILVLNRWQVERSVQLVTSFSPKKVTVLGVSFKPNTSVVVDSQGLAIAEALAQRGLKVTVYDPMALDEARRVLGDRVDYARSLEDAVRDSDVLFVAVEWSEFRKLSSMNLREDQVVVDPWRLLRKEFSGRARYVAFGVGRSS